MPRIAGRPAQDRERFMLYFDRSTLTAADDLAAKLSLDIPDGKSKVSRSDVLREAARFAVTEFPDSVGIAVAATHPSLRTRET